MRFSLFATLASVAFSHAGFYNGISDRWSFDVDTLNHAKWMSALNDDVHLTDLFIPGTRSSMTDKIKDGLLQTQNKPLLQQLIGGIRYIDIACRYVNHDMMVYNGRVSTGYSLENVLTTLFDFLVDSPREAIILRIQKGSTADDAAVFLDSMETYFVPGSELGDRAAQYIYSTEANGNTIPTLGKVRGKVLILQDFKTRSPGRYGIPWNSHTVSSYTQRLALSSRLLRLKWAGVKSHISKSPSKNHEQLLITHTTGGAGVNPINIAARNAGKRGMNGLLGRYMLLDEGKCFGIVVMDFPGFDLVQGILRLNNPYRTPQVTELPFDNSDTSDDEGLDFGFHTVNDYEPPLFETDDDETSDIEGGHDELDSIIVK